MYVFFSHVPLLVILHAFFHSFIVQSLSILTIIVLYYAVLDSLMWLAILSKESVFTNLIKYVCMCVYMYVRMYVCMYVCMCVCRCMYVCMYVCACKYV